jgi:metal-responsive CopG/Arc/MetJ family transcriptional regulator
MPAVSRHSDLTQWYDWVILFGMKVAISIPDDVFEAAEEASARLRIPRSRFYAEAVRAYARAHSGEEVTRQLNEVYSHEASKVESEVEEASLEVLRQEKW